MPPKLSPETIHNALRQASDEEILAEAGRRRSAMRKFKTGGRNGGRPKMVACRDCNGTGKLWDQHCGWCKGKGKVPFISVLA